MANARRVVAASLTGAAALVMLLSNFPFFPFAEVDFGEAFGDAFGPSDGSGFEDLCADDPQFCDDTGCCAPQGSFFGIEITSNAWGMTASGGGDSEFTSWYSNDFDESDGVGLLRASGPLLVVSTLATVAAGTLLLARPGGAGSGTAFAAAALLGATFAVLLSGLVDSFDGADYLNWHAAFYLYLVCFAALVAAGFLGLGAATPAPPRGAAQPAAAGGPRPSAVATGRPTAMAPTGRLGQSATLTGPRPGRCPKCQTAVTIVPGKRTVCPRCGFSA